MGITDDVKAMLTADTGAGGVATLLTGGIYTYAETRSLGISDTTTPGAFNSTTGLLKPCALVKGRNQVPDGQVVDAATQETSYRQIVEVWFYDDANRGYATIASARLKTRALLHKKRAGGVWMRWAIDILEQRDEPLQHACMERADFQASAVWRP